MNHTKLLLLRFQNPITHTEIPSFRGAIINALKDKDILFHNHTSENSGFRYSYPLIQYKRINKNASILCIESGTESIGKLFTHSNLELNINGRREKFIVDNIKAYKHLIQVWDTKFHYHIRKWLALNQENYERFEQLESIAEKSLFLENILKGNILSFAKGINLFVEKQIECKLTWISEPVLMRYKGIKMMALDAEFISNVSIPDFCGLGKGVSVGFGTTVKYKKIN
ncbi:MAG: hypothetical protein MR982_02920 [Bacteroides pyogenes]|uniref:CRISPR-associated endonuclease Cas6 n=1 Tax=Bacteroides pyogenes TaxID=310300 RepID=UPI00242B836B|nr:CRISPR-associated endonuclease Cas6 [Bacteroides pyogenes]MCI7069920.1 hypothetical protein [Bacteroides pyogenes]